MSRARLDRVIGDPRPPPGRCSRSSPVAAVTTGRSGRPDRRPARATKTALTAGYGRVTPAERRTIDQVVDAGLAAGRVATTATPRSLVDHVVRCATFEGQRYCLGHGLDRRTQAQVQATYDGPSSRAGPRRPTTSNGTGDLATVDALRQAARMTPAGARGGRERPSSPRPRARWPRSGCSATRSRACRCRRTSSPATPRSADTTADSTDAGRVTPAETSGRRMEALARLSRQGRRPQPPPGHRAAPHLLVRPDDDADDRLGLDRHQALPAPLGRPARHHHVAAPRSPTWSAWSTEPPATTARRTPAPTSRSTSATGPSASGSC